MRSIPCTRWPTGGTTGVVGVLIIVGLSMTEELRPHQKSNSQNGDQHDCTNPKPKIHPSVSMPQASSTYHQSKIVS
jgi:hypothetical protein